MTIGELIIQCYQTVRIYWCEF